MDILLHLIALLMAASVPSPHWPTVSTKVISLSRPGIQFSVPASWWMATEEFDHQNNAFSPPFPAGGTVRITAGGETLVLAYLIFDPRYLSAQRQRDSDLPRYRQSKVLKRRMFLRGMEVLEFGYRNEVKPGMAREVRGVLFEKGRIECEITTLVKGNRAAINRGMASFAPVFNMIVKTMIIKGPAGKIS